MKDQAIVTDNGETTSLVEVPVGQTPSQLVNIPSDEIMAKIEAAQKADIEKAPEAGTKYWELQKGKEMRGVFLGFKVITAKDGDNAGELLPCPVIQVSKYQAYMSAAIQLASNFQTIPTGSAVFVRCDECKSGQTAQFTVKVLEA